MAKKKQYITASDESINVYGWRILTDGIDLDWMINHNPVMLFNHDGNNILGKWAEIIKEDGMVLSLPEFDEDDEDALKYKRKYEKQMLNCASIHVDIIEFSDDPELMLPGQINPTVTKSIAREISLTPTPGNRNAVRLTYNGETFNLQQKKQRLALSTSIEQSIDKQANKSQMEFKKQVAAALGLSADISDEKLMQAVKTAKSGADESDNLKTKVQELNDARANDLVKGIDDETSKNSVLKLAENDYDLAAQLAEQLKATPAGEQKKERKTITQQLSANAPATDAGKPDKTWDDYQKDDVKTLQLMADAPKGSENRNQFEKLYKDKYGVNPAE